MNEVFSKLAPPLQTFLLYTSLLEQLTADTCNVLTNRTDAQLVLLELDQQGLFISRVEAKEQVFDIIIYLESIASRIEQSFYPA